MTLFRENKIFADVIELRVLRRSSSGIIRVDLGFNNRCAPQSEAREHLMDRRGDHVTTEEEMGGLYPGAEDTDSDQKLEKPKNIILRAPGGGRPR